MPREGGRGAGRTYAPMLLLGCWGVSGLVFIELQSHWSIWSRESPNLKMLTLEPDLGADRSSPRTAGPIKGAESGSRQHSNRNSRSKTPCNVKLELHPAILYFSKNNTSSARNLSNVGKLQISHVFPQKHGNSHQQLSTLPDSLLHCQAPSPRFWEDKARFPGKSTTNFLNIIVILEVDRVECRPIIIVMTCLYSVCPPTRRKLLSNQHNVGV